MPSSEVDTFEADASVAPDRTNWDSEYLFLPLHMHRDLNIKVRADLSLNTVERDRKLLMFVAKVFLGKDMKIDNQAAATKVGLSSPLLKHLTQTLTHHQLSCTVRAVEERLKKIKKSAMIETAPETPYSE